MFGLKERLAYKKGRVSAKRQGQKDLADYLALLADSTVLPLHISENWNKCMSKVYIDSLSGAGLKQNEDLLDAIVCLYIAGLYTLNPNGRVFGDTREGYIYVPNQRCVSSRT